MDKPTSDTAPVIEQDFIYGVKVINIVELRAARGMTRRRIPVRPQPRLPAPQAPSKARKTLGLTTAVDVDQDRKNQKNCLFPASLKQ